MERSTKAAMERYARASTTQRAALDVSWVGTVFAGMADLVRSLHRA